MTIHSVVTDFYAYGHNISEKENASLILTIFEDVIFLKFLVSRR